jgi:hypothetical protein
MARMPAMPSPGVVINVRQRGGSGLRTATDQLPVLTILLSEHAVLRLTPFGCGHPSLPGQNLTDRMSTKRGQ